jgi:hypothetical protein
MRADHVRRRPGFIDEYQPLGFEVRLPLEPVAALLQDIRAILLNRMSGLFLRVIP